MTVVTKEEPREEAVEQSQEQPKPNGPGWYDLHFKEALELLRGEMMRAGVTRITELTLEEFAFERMESGRLK